MDPTTKRALGSTGIELTQLGLGGASYGSLNYEVPEMDALGVIEVAWEAGVRYFDTAPWYGRGLSELRTGAGLRYRPRDEFVLSTKVGRWLKAQIRGSRSDLGPWKAPVPFDVVFDYSYDGIMRAYEQSQLRLGLGWYDIAVIHDLDSMYHLTEAKWQAHFHQLVTGGWRALTELKSHGLIKAVGAGINHLGLIPQFLENLDLDFFLMSMQYNLLDQHSLEGDFQLMAERGVGAIVGTPFASGLLAKVPGSDGLYNYADAPADVTTRIEGMHAVCARHGVSLAAVALQFPLAHPVVASVIPGARSAEQQQRTVSYFREPIPADVWTELKSEGLLREDAPVPS
jgi:D-threo-aldose 1-dehydrogenase